MSLDDWWQIVEQARSTVDDADDADAVADEVRLILQERDPEEVAELAQPLWDLLASSYNWELWAAAYLINGGASDDGFEYFRGWLVTQGRDVFEQAQDDPDSTDPPKDGHKDIPGKYIGVLDDRALTRIDTSSQTYTNNRAEVAKACAPITPPTDMERPECDEYPFASTAQGAASPIWDFSVKYVPGTQNGSAGNGLMAFYRDDRILYDRDAFYVEIRDQEGDQGSDAPVVKVVPEVFGNEGEAVPLAAQVYGPASSVHWTFTPLENVDAGADCSFNSTSIQAPTITCTDDGVFQATITVDDGVHAPVSANVRVNLHNVAPKVKITSPRPWDLFRVGEPITVVAPIDDPGANDTHSCQYGWDDGNGWAPVFDTPYHNCETVHSFAHAGMYTLDLFVADDDGGTGAIEPVMIVVYDPNAGTLNIDGSMATAAGALAANPSVTGQTWVHYTGAYPLGGDTPYGQSKAWVENTDFRMEPSTMEWLVVTPDGKVASRGTGTVAGQSGYTWVLYGWDACDSSNRPACRDIGTDEIRLLVFRSVGGQIVYDSQPGSREFDVDRIAPRTMTSGAVQIHR